MLEKSAVLAYNPSHGHAVDDNLSRYLSPLGWEHINLASDYLWRDSAKVGVGKFRLLRATAKV